MATSRDPARLRQGLNPLSTTTLGALNAQPQTPISAVSMASSHATSVQTPGSAIQPYNPQEWVASPAPAPAPPPMADRSHHFQPEAQAPPPPPYSPPRSQQPRPMSTAFEHTLMASTPSPRITNATVAALRPSPEPQTNRSFPPPPGSGGGRGASRERRFGLPSLGRRKETETVSTSPDHQPFPSHSRRSMGPLTFRSPEPEPGPSTTSPAYEPAVAPASRRAASTGAIGTPTSARSRSESQTRWEPGMPLPPPPPGPPPPGSRSQSVQSIDRTTVPILSPPTRRPPPSGVASLGPVPPTPADWVDSDAQPTQPAQATRGRSPGLTIDTETANTSDQVPEAPASSSSASGLNRAKAVRHDKTIIQRRAESRTRHSLGSSIDVGSNSRMISDILVPTSGGGVHRKLEINSSTPRSGGFNDLSRTGELSSHQDSRNSTPRAPDSASLTQLETATPPFSPYPIKSAHSANGSLSMAPKALPTPPPQTRSASSSQPRDSSRPPVSAITASYKHQVINQSAEQFSSATIERFQAFSAKEASAATDADRVRLFADFIVSESRIRRERYAGAIGAMGSEIFDLTRDLFRPMVTGRRESTASQEELTPASTEPNRSGRDSTNSNYASEGMSNSAPASANLPPSPSGVPAGSGNWATNYMPSLSPILSMSVSENYENGSSRGRPPSRWWEADSQGGDPNRGFERSKRESKYMGVPKEKWVETDQSLEAYASTSAQASSSSYPPEKVGWHETEEASWTPQPLRFSNASLASSPSPAPHNQGLLDVSRLVTMPPPYPRHHPAVNNNHPQLTSTRTSVRTLSEFVEMDAAKERFAVSSSKRREEFSKAASERRQALRANLQQEIGSGNMGYADAAAIEADSQQQEMDNKKDLEKAEYEKFQNEVVLPINDLLTERICRATDLFDDLARRLFDHGENDADMPQEEGDDRPELLEKLTLLKWIFEMREGLHRAIYDLLSDRNDRFREVVLTPYRLSGNTEKLSQAELFFAEDNSKREYAYANEVLDRTREFRSVMEEAVQRGVALQLSAFWDIAPPLRRLLDSIPSNLDGFGTQIPAAEFEENPMYRDHPLQYLYSLVLHTEKSTYQFIESHTNQLCLLHEVKEAVVHAKAKVLEVQVSEANGVPISKEERETRAKTMRESEDRRLTEDLKEKVRVVQDQWNGALGEGIKNVKERTGEWLLQTGGWDETLEEGAFGGA